MVGRGKPADETTTAGDGAATRGGPDVARVRTWAAQAVWLVCVLAATSLAVAALCIAVDANQDNGLVGLALDLARFFDLGVFTLDDGIMAFTGDNADTKNALINYGLGAAFYLVVGRVVERFVRP